MKSEVRLQGGEYFSAGVSGGATDRVRPAGASAPSAVAKTVEPQAVIVPMRAEHVPGAVQLHRALFPNETMVRLGPKVVEAVYRTYVESPRGIAFVAVHTGAVVGLVTGAIGPGFLREVVRTHRWRVMAAAVRSVVRSPRFIGQLVSVLRRPREPWPGNAARRFYFRMQMIAPEWRGRGIVLPMVRAMLTEARQHGALDACSTVFDHNLEAIWVHKVFRFESRAVGSGPRYYFLALDKLNSAAAPGSAAASVTYGTAT